MYFSNIASNELKPFHNMFGVDFSMSLTKLLNSRLFKIETIIPDKMYRAYPLFYCKQIISSNPEDRILDNKCLILNKAERETYLSFTTQADETIYIDEEWLSIKNIGDNLTVEEFNQFIYLLRKNTILNGTLNYKQEKTITGEYATYQFENIDSQLANNQGLIINDALKNNPLTVKLTNPFFVNANYNLTFTVKSITGANILDDDTTDYITVDTFTAQLIKNNSVEIDLSSYTNDSILLFDVDCNIDFNVPEIRISESISLTADSTRVLINTNVNLTAMYRDDNGDPAAGKTIVFKENVSTIGQAITDQTGKATITYTPTAVGAHTINAESGNVISNNLTIEAISYDGMTLTSDRDILSYNGGTNPDVATLTAQLTSGGEPVAVEGETVTFEVRKQSDDSLVETLSDVTDSSGVASVGYTSKGAGDIYIKAECMFLIQTYSISDWNYYSLPSSDKSSDFIPVLLEGGTNPSISFDTDSYLATHGSKTSAIQIPCELPTNCIISAKIKVNAVNVGLGVTKGTGYGDGFVLGNNICATYRYSNSAWQSSFYSTTNVSYTQSNYNELTIEKTGQSVVIKLNGNTITSKTLQFSNSDTLYSTIVLSGGGSGNIKEITIKPL